MKTLTKGMLALALALGGLGTALAQNTTIKDGFVMEHGEMMIVRNGAAKEMAQDMKLRNGTEVRTDGLVIPPDADRFRLKEGDSLGFDGSVIKAGSAPAPTAKN
jgi:hypothetical protein